MTLSLCMIIRDEIFFIEECLEAVRPYVDEIILVDTGSKDGTREIAERLSSALIDFEWIDDFSAARNVSLNAASGDWVLVLDADERIASEDFVLISKAMESDDFDGFYLDQRRYTDNQLRRNWQPCSADEKYSNGYKGFSSNPIMRLFRSRPDIFYQGVVHEIVDGTISDDRRGELPIVIHHYGDTNPSAERETRELKYLKMMDKELSLKDDGRLFAIAGSSAMYAAQDYEKAERYLTRAAELGYDSAASLEGAAEAAYRGGSIGRAQDIYHALYSQNHRTPSLCLNMANLAARSGNNARAIALLEECLDLGGMGEATDNTIRANIRVLAG